MFGGLFRDARPAVDAYRLHYDELTVRGSSTTPLRPFVQPSYSLPAARTRGSG